MASLLRLFHFRDILFASPFALAFLLGALQLLQVSGISFSVMEHRMWFEIPFDIGLSLEWPVILLAIVCVVLLAMRRSLFVSLPLVSIISYTVWGFSVAVPLVALAASLGGLLELRRWDSYAFTILGALSYESALNLTRESLLGLNDSLAVHVMRREGIDEIYSMDRHFDSFEGIVRL